MTQSSFGFVLHYLAVTENLDNAIMGRSTLCIDTSDEETFASVCYNDNARLATHLAPPVATVLSADLKPAP